MPATKVKLDPVMSPAQLCEVLKFVKDRPGLEMFVRIEDRRAYLYCVARSDDGTGSVMLSRELPILPGGDEWWTVHGTS